MNNARQPRRKNVVILEDVKQARQSAPAAPVTLLEGPFRSLAYARALAFTVGELSKELDRIDALMKSRGWTE